MKKAIDLIQEIQTIPCVDKNLALGLIEIGIYSLKDLKEASPENLFQTLSTRRQQKTDRSILYMLKCAVYYASHTRHDPNLLKWQNWADC